MATWELFYHADPFKGRAEFVRLMFEVAGVSYTEKGGDEMAAILAAWKPSSEILAMTKANFAPPVIRRGEFSLSQTTAILQYLGEEYGMMPSSLEERTFAMQLTLSVADALNECRGPFHPKVTSGSYSIQKEEAVVSVKEFCKDDGRWDKWLFHFANVISLRRAGTGKADGFLFGAGDKIMYPDVALFYMVEAMQSQFADGTPFPYWTAPCRAKAVEVLESFLAACRTVPNLHAYLDSGRRRPWAGDSCM